jgi:quinol monooxygenase YgiN
MLLRSIVEQTRHIEGCAGCRLYQDLQDERALMLEESWAGEKALRRHLRSEAFRHILLVVEMATEAPEIRFDWISHSAGIETINDARLDRKPLTGMTA